MPERNACRKTSRKRKNGQYLLEMVRALCIDNTLMTLDDVKSICQKDNSILTYKTAWQRAHAASEHQLNSRSDPVSLLVSREHVSLLVLIESYQMI